MATESETVDRWISGGGMSAIRREEASGDACSALPHASLTSLVGPQRAEILRLLEVPATCGRIAETLMMVPGGVTHHLRSLEAAGLVQRTRCGRHVLVERTARGLAVMALYPAEADG